MTDQLQPTAEVAVANGVVTHDFPCRKCAYNLRGLAANGICPECAAPVEISIGDDLLRYSHPTYLNGLRRGIHLIFAGIVAVFAIVIVRIFLSHAAGAMSLGSLLQLAGSSLIIIGSWRLTTPDPSGIGEARYGTIRRTIRICLIAGVADDVVQTAMNIAMMPLGAVPALRVISVLASIVNVVGQVALLEYLSRLAARMPEPALENRAKSLMKAIGICSGIVIAVSLPIKLVGAALAPFFIPFGCIGMIAGVVLLVLYVRYLVLLGNFASQFGQQAERATLLWAVAETNSRQGDGSALQ